ncbi:hypothetical protein NKH57_23495 [Mesorhizobium sp. M1050]
MAIDELLAMRFSLKPSATLQRPAIASMYLGVDDVDAFAVIDDKGAVRIR